MYSLFVRLAMSSAEQSSQADTFDDELASLLSQHAELEQQIRTNRIERAEINPIYAIDDDILQHIFEAAWSADVSPFIISHVCRRWRKASLAFPYIWRCINLSLAPPLVRLCCERSGAMPIHIVYHESKKTAELYRKRLDLQGNIEESYSAKMSCALQYRARWTSCSVRTYLLPLLEIFGRLAVDQEMPMLEHMDVRLLHLPRTGRVWGTKFYMPKCPRLATLVMLGVETPLTSPALRNIRQLHLADREVSNLHLWDLASATSRLQELTVHNTYPGSGGRPPHGTTVVFPSLHKLEFSDIDWGGYALNFQAPSLTAMSYRNFSLAERSLESLDSPNIVFPTYPAVKHLQLIHGVALTAAHDGHVLRRFPNVTRLDFIHCKGTFSFLDCLHVPINGEDVFFPLMETLTIDLHISPPDEGDPAEYIRGALVCLLNDRLRRQAPLRELRLSTTTLDVLGPELVTSISALFTVEEISHDAQRDRREHRRVDMFREREDRTPRHHTAPARVDLIQGGRTIVLM